MDLFSVTTTVTSGKLVSTVTPAEYCAFLHLNDGNQLSRFGLQPDGSVNKKLLNDRWEGLAAMPVEDGKDGEWWVLAVTDNDFITQDGYISAGHRKYKDKSGLNIDTEALIYKMQLPMGSSIYPRQ